MISAQSYTQQDKVVFTKGFAASTLTQKLQQDFAGLKGPRYYINKRQRLIASTSAAQ